MFGAGLFWEHIKQEYLNWHGNSQENLQPPFARWVKCQEVKQNCELIFRGIWVPQRIDEHKATYTWTFNSFSRSVEGVSWQPKFWRKIPETFKWCKFSWVWLWYDMTTYGSNVCPFDHDWPPDSWIAFEDRKWCQICAPSRKCLLATFRLD